MSALGHKRTLARVRAMSALPPKADIRYGDRHVRFVPKAQVDWAFDEMRKLVDTLPKSVTSRSFVAR